MTRVRITYGVIASGLPRMIGEVLDLPDAEALLLVQIGRAERLPAEEKTDSVAPALGTHAASAIVSRAARRRKDK